MSNLDNRVSKLEQQSGGGSIVIAVWDDREPLVDGKPQVRISGTDIWMPLDEFRARYPENAAIMHIVFDVKPIGPLS